MKKNSNNIFFLSLVFFLTFWVINIPVPAKAEVINKVLAIVNDKIITYSDLMRMLYPLYVQYQRVYTQEDMEKKLLEAREDILNQLIENELILQEAKKRSKKEEDFNIPEKNVKEYVAGIITKFPSKEVFLQNLAEEKMTLQEFEKSIHDQFLVKKLTVKEVAARILITPKDVKNKYEEEKNKYRQPEEFRVYHIMIKKAESSEEDKEKKAIIEEIAASVNDESTFQSSAKKYSEGPNRDKGGDMGFLKKGTLMAELDQQLDNLKTGEVSRIIETEIGYHLIFLKARKKSEPIPLTEVWDQIKNELYNEQADSIRKAWIQDLKDKAYIKIIDE